MTAEAPDNTRLWASPYATTVAATALIFVSIGITIPILPFVVRDDLGAGDSAVGLVFAAAAVSAVLCRPALGWIGDVRGRRPLFLIGAGLCALGLLGHLIAVDMTTLVIARLVLGAGQAAVMVAATTLAIDLAPDGRRGEASSYLFIALQVGLGTGPAIGEGIGHFGVDAVWFSATCACVLSALLASRLPRIARRSRAQRAADVVGVSVDYGLAIRIGLLAGLGTLGFAGYLAFLPLYATTIDVGSTAVVFLLASGTIAAVRLCAAKVPDRFGARPVARTSLATLTVGFVLLAAWHTQVGLLVGTVVMAAGMSLLVPSLVLGATAGVSEGEQTRRMSVFTLFLDVAAALGPAMLGIVATAASYTTAFAVCAGAAVLALCLLLRWVPSTRPA